MRTFLILTCSLIFLNLLSAEINNSGTIEITVTNVESSEGQVRAVLFKSSEGFPQDKDKAIESSSVPAKEGKTKLIFNNIPYGEYALSVLHDQNSNGKLDTNIFGYPQEGYGISNNEIPAISIPPYDDARFELKQANKKMLIHLRN